MAINVKAGQRSLIPSSKLTRLIGERGDVHACRECGQRMFVKSESGLCPFCFNKDNPMAQENLDLWSDAEADEIALLAAAAGDDGGELEF